MADLAPTEIKALARILGELDYYQLLHLERSATDRELKAAYHASARAFHPDGNRHLERDLRRAVEQIAKRITEAYSVLRHPRRRAAYDQRLETNGSVRMQLAEAEEAGRQATEKLRGRTAQGRQFSSMAEADIARGDHAAAERNLVTALTFESDNEAFKTRLAEVRRKLR